MTNETTLTESELDALISAYLDCKAIARNTGITHHDMSPLTAAVDKILADRMDQVSAMEAEWGVRYGDFPDQISRRRSEDVVRREMALCRKHSVDAVPVRREVTAWREADGLEAS